MARKKKQKIDIPKLRYKIFCHRCFKIQESKEPIEVGCTCKGTSFTYTDNNLLTSKYVVKN